MYKMPGISLHPPGTQLGGPVDDLLSLLCFFAAWLSLSLRLPSLIIFEFAEPCQARRRTA